MVIRIDQLRIWVLLFVFNLAVLAQSASALEITWSDQDGKVTALINWCDVANREKCEESPPRFTESQPRIDSDDVVAVQVTGFNFLHYNIEYDIDESTVEAYAYLAGLWDQILGFDFQQQLGISGESVTWWKAVREKRRALKDTLDQYKDSSALNARQLSTLRSQRAAWLGQVQELDKLRVQAFESASTIEELQQFDIVDKEHHELVEAIANFGNLANRTLNGDRKNIGRKKQGTSIAVSASAKPLPGTTVEGRLPSTSLSYFVESTFPLLFHIGLTHTQLEEAEFATVRALDGRDLFAQVKSSEGTESFSAFLSYPLGTRDSESARWFATLGTDFSEIGDQIYVGLSGRFDKKWFISAGGAYGLVKEGVDGSEEQNPGQGTARTLYELVDESREWAVFVSVSVALF